MYYYYFPEEGNDCGVIFYCGWARRLNYMNGWKTSARCHSNCAATSPAQSFMIYYINHCTAFTHTQHRMLKTQRKQSRRAPDFRYSNPKHDTLFLFSFFSWRNIFTPSQTAGLARAFSERPSVCRIPLNPRILRYSFQLSKFRRKGKGNLERERRGKALLGAAEKPQTDRTTGAQTLSISERSLSCTLTLIVPSILRNFQWSPTIFQT